MANDSTTTLTPATYQLFKNLSPAVESALLASIDRFGVLVPVAKDQHGNILDGHQRARLADSLGIKYPVNIIEVADDAEAREIARTLNEDRRAMPKAERLPVAVALAEEGHSPRAIAGALGVDEKTIRNDLSGADYSAPGRVLGSAFSGTNDRPVVSTRSLMKSRAWQNAQRTWEHFPLVVSPVGVLSRVPSIHYSMSTQSVSCRHKASAAGILGGSRRRSYTKDRCSVSVDAPASPRNAIPPTDRVLVSEDDAAVLLSVSKPTLRKYAALGLIRRVEMPTGTRRNLFRTSDLEAFAAGLASTTDVRTQPVKVAS